MTPDLLHVHILAKSARRLAIVQIVRYDGVAFAKQLILRAEVGEEFLASLTELPKMARAAPRG